MLIIIFVLGYLSIALEHSLKVDKAAAAVLTGVLCWTVLMVSPTFVPEAAIPKVDWVDAELLEHLGEISEILFFLLGAMTIVELIDAHGGFRVITDRIRTTNRVKLLWIISILTFFLSAVLDNLTTSIVMVALLRKLLSDQEDRWLFGGMVIISANAGGAWSPIGDVTTIMLWIGGQITAVNIILEVLIPSIVCLVVPLLILSFRQRGELKAVSLSEHGEGIDVGETQRNLVLGLGVAGLLFVPVFKNLTHLPPFMGILLSLGLLWIATELLHRSKPAEEKHELSVAGVIRRIDTPSILFFLGILLAVAALQTAGLLQQLAELLDRTFGNIVIINGLIGALSAIVDNVPLVAAAMGMYDMNTYPVDHEFWELLAYCAGTGGSMLIIGSAAGVAVMGLLKIDFMWYLRRMSLLAAAGYLAGLLTMYLLG